MHPRLFTRGPIGVGRWRSIFFVLVLLVLPTRAVVAQPWRLLTLGDPGALDAAVSAHRMDGFRPVSITSSTSLIGVRYTAVFHDDAIEDWTYERGLSRPQAQALLTSRISEGYIPVCIVGTGSPESETYLIVTARHPGPATQFRLNQTAAQLNNEINGGLGALGYTVWNISAWGTGTNRRFATVWQRCYTGWWIGWGQTPASHAATNAQVDPWGFRMVSCSPDSATSDSTLSSAWGPFSNPGGRWLHFLSQTQAQFDATRDQLTADGYRPSLVTAFNVASSIRYHSVWLPPEPGLAWRARGREIPGLDAIDAAMRTYMQERGIPGGQLCVTHEGRLVYSRAFTWAGEETPDVVTGNRFRLASVTKTVWTSTAIMQLIERGQLSLDDTMVSILGGSWTDPRAGAITVRHLLQHTGGWDRNIAGDPLFNDRAIASSLGEPLPLSRDDIVRYMRTRPLNHAPGTRFAYSNFGYLLLGQIVEAVVGRSLESFVHENTWTPLGAEDGPRVGGAFLPMPNEPVYVDPSESRPLSVYSNDVVTGPYGAFNMETLEGSGNATASARDLARFTGSFSNPEASPILSPESIDLAWNSRVAILGSTLQYGLGWVYTPKGMLVADGMWHDGALTGTQTMIKVRFDGLTFAVVFNANHIYISDLAWMPYIDAVLDPVLDGIAHWPAGDLRCPADYNLDAALNSQDFFEFLTAFFGGDADFNDDTVTNSQDFFDFLAMFFEGCP